MYSAFGDLIKILWSNPTFSSTRPVELKRLVGKIANRFMGYEQQDAQEFLRFLLDGLHEDLNQIKQKPAYYEIKEQDDANAGQIQKDQAISKEYWIFYQERNMSLLTELFCGQLRSEICCTICQHRSLCFDVFWDLSVPLPKKTTTSANNNNTTSTTITTTTTKSSSHHHLMRIFNKTSSTTTKTNVDDIDEMTTGTGSSSCTSGVSIQDCLRAYTEEEFLHEEDAYYCSKCKQHRAVSKKISIYRLPQILVIHLKRFSFSTFTRDKVNTAIQFPLQSLDVKDYCAKDGFIQESGSNGSTLYDLFGIVHHVGSLNRGHYTA
jgi:ubiquitin carboxyl-terminal hydrolase 2/21